MSTEIVATLENRVLELRINRPEKRNALTRPMYTAQLQSAELKEAVAAFFEKRAPAF